MNHGLAWRIAALGITLIVIFLVFSRPVFMPHKALKKKPDESSLANIEPSSDAARSTPATPDPRRVTALQPGANGLVVWPGAASATSALNKNDRSAREDIDAVHNVLSNYQSAFGEVPEGGLNAEITRGLRGDNPKKIVFLVEKPGMLDNDGALLDRWGTPYFFHKLSSRIIDLRSAGPDRKFWTKDDVFDATTGGPTL